MRLKIALLCAPAFATIAATAFALQPAPVAAAAAGRPQLGTYGFDTAGMDASVAPGTDFYDHANGT